MSRKGTHSTWLLTHRNTKFNPENCSTFVGIVAHYWTSIYWDFFLYEFNNYCNILSPEEFNRRAVSFEALYALNVRHAARGSRAHTHHNSPMALCRAFHFCRRILLIIVISCSLRTRAILNGPVVRIHVSKYRNCACVSLVHQQVRNTKICAHLMSREPLFYVQPNYSSSLHIHRVLFFHSLVRSYTRSVFMHVPCSELWRRS